MYYIVIYFSTERIREGIRGGEGSRRWETTVPRSPNFFTPLLRAGFYAKGLRATTRVVESAPMDPALLAKAVPGLPASVAAVWSKPLAQTFAEFAIDTPRRQSAFLAQAGHESGSFARLVESLNYSQAGLAATFPSRVSAAQAAKLGRQPGEQAVPAARQALIGDLVYGGRMGNGAPGDGFRYRARGAIGITGKDNYRACGQALGLDLVNAPELLQVLPGAARSAGWFWSTHGCNALADADQFDRLTAAINGGQNGASDRRERWEVAKRALGV